MAGEGATQHDRLAGVRRMEYSVVAAHGPVGVVVVAMPRSTRQRTCLRFANEETR